jgi:hypothetical protein
VLHIVSGVLIAAGFILIGAAWNVLYQAQRQHRLATTGAYAYVRHPQYVGFILIMLGFLVQWPTILTLLMFPLLVLMYARLAHLEEAEARHAFGRSMTAIRPQSPAGSPVQVDPVPGGSLIDHCADERLRYNRAAVELRATLGQVAE